MRVTDATLVEEELFAVRMLVEEALEICFIVKGINGA